jgi:hypothetical protein
MTKVKIKVDFEVGAGEDSAIKQAINEKFTNKIIDNETVPRIGECVDLLKVSQSYELNKEELQWLSSREHRYLIENVNKCDGYIEVELDLDKIWPEEA